MATSGLVWFRLTSLEHSILSDRMKLFIKNHGSPEGLALWKEKNEISYWICTSKKYVNEIKKEFNDFGIVETEKVPGVDKSIELVCGDKKSLTFAE